MSHEGTARKRAQTNEGADYIEFWMEKGSAATDDLDQIDQYLSQFNGEVVEESRRKVLVRISKQLRDEHVKNAERVANERMTAKNKEGLTEDLTKQRPVTLAELRDQETV